MLGPIRVECKSFGQIHANWKFRYVLAIQILDTVKTVEFKVRDAFIFLRVYLQVSVLSHDLKPKIQITTPESYVILNQIYYAPGTQIGVLCSAESIPLPSVVKLSYRYLNAVELVHEL